MNQILVLKAAIEAAGSTDPAAINAALKEIENLPGVTTDSITYKDMGGIPLKRMTMIEVIDGKFTPAQLVLPAFVPNP